MFKKGEMTINIVIVAIIALIVLVILLAIFSGKMGILNGGIDSKLDQTCNGQIISINEQCPQGSIASMGKTYKNVQEGMQCCIPIPPSN